MIYYANKAVEYYLKAYNIDPNDGETLAQVALAISITGDDVKANQYINKALIISPNNSHVLKIDQKIRSFLNS